MEHEYMTTLERVYNAQFDAPIGHRAAMRAYWLHYQRHPAGGAWRETTSSRKQLLDAAM